ncbi:MAG: hypothetical protein KKH70_20265 [Gammaproteobacteria bacterium]|nr:hypothetical protein [Gammaproteobacteria bacterium]
MPYLRFNLQLAIPLTGDVPVGASPKDVVNKLPIELQDKMVDFAREVRRFRKYAVIINEGKDSEEITVIANCHICRHDEGESCDPEVEI